MVCDRYKGGKSSKLQEENELALAISLSSLMSHGSITPLWMEMKSGQEPFSQQLHSTEGETLLFNFLSSGDTQNGCDFKRQVIWKVDGSDEWESTLAVKRINTSALGKPSGNAIPRG